MIAIVDYGMGNLASVQHALKHLGVSSIATDQADELSAAESIILPGVGAFSEAMNRLNEKGLSKVIRQEVHSGKKFLGICLGLQLLFDESEEGPGAGLELVHGLVKRFPDSEDFLIPHIGWNRIDQSKTNLIREDSYMYFVHSYHVVPKDEDFIAATSTHGITFVAAVQKDNLTAVQFHPEKSGSEGLQIIQSWLEI